MMGERRRFGVARQAQDLRMPTPKKMRLSRATARYGSRSITS
jgi:hypothetical protein